MCRVIKELKPRFVLGENVANFINMGINKTILDLEKAGYAVWTFLLAASAHGMNASELLSWGYMFPTLLASDTGKRPIVPQVVLSPAGSFRRKKKTGHWSANLSEAIYYLEKDAAPISASIRSGQSG